MLHPDIEVWEKCNGVLQFKGTQLIIFLFLHEILLPRDNDKVLLVLIPRLRGWPLPLLYQLSRWRYSTCLSITFRIIASYHSFFSGFTLTPSEGSNNRIHRTLSFFIQSHNQLWSSWLEEFFVVFWKCTLCKCWTPDHQWTTVTWYQSFCWCACGHFSWK